jgi:hypothetical protein
MTARRDFVIAAANMFLLAIPMFAHHALEAEYDPKQTITLSGTIQKMTWENPHAHLYLDVAQGTAAKKWSLEMASPNILILNGLKMENLKPGTRVTVNAYPSRHAMDQGYVTKVTLQSR